MKARVVTGAIAAVLLVALIVKGPVWLVAAVVVVFSLGAYYEYERLFFPKPNWLRLGRVAVYLTASLLALGHSLEAWAVTAWLVFVVHCALHVALGNASEDLVKTVSAFRVELFGWLYCTALFGFLLPLARVGTHGRELLLLLFLVVSVGDTMAYFVGTWLGKHRIAPAISPKKSVEGSLGGLAGSMLMAWLWVERIYTGERTQEFLWWILGFGVVGGLLAQFADLFESLLKRSRSVKDSGGLLPGHGGILDRTDGLALAAPCFYLFVKYILARVS